jgi:hypothetical protein
MTFAGNTISVATVDAANSRPVGERDLSHVRELQSVQRLPVVFSNFCELVERRTHRSEFGTKRFLEALKRISVGDAIGTAVVEARRNHTECP